jgi:K+-transporting ATPase ATPase C chain
MRIVSKDIITAALAMLVITVLCGILYPLVITGIGQVAFHANANGQLVKVNGHVVGSKLIGQNFSTPVIGKNGKPETSDGEPVTAPDPKYFQTRPSGTDDGVDNDAFTSFANYGPNSTITLAALKANIAGYIALNGKYVPGGLTAAKVPVDAADTSASGVDPDISVANADLQAYRIASVRDIPLTTVKALVKKYTGGRGLGFVGDPDVNVLELNLALDRISK